MLTLTKRRPLHILARPNRPVGGDFATWARSVVGRYRRLASRQHLPQRRFLRLALPRFGERIIERLRSVVHRVAPRIHVHLGRQSSFPMRADSPTQQQLHLDPPRRLGATTTGPSLALAEPRPAHRVKGLASEAAPRSNPPAPAEAPTEAPGRRRHIRGLDTNATVREVVKHRHQRLEPTIDSLSVRHQARRKTRIEERALVRATRIVKRTHDHEAGELRSSPHGVRHPADASHFVSRPGATQRASHGTAPAPPIDIHTITDQVVRRIDRRLKAWRERTGRI